MKQLSNARNLLVLVFLLATSMLFTTSCKKVDTPCKKTAPLIAVFHTQSVLIPVGTTQQITATGTGDGTPIGTSSFVGHGQLDANNTFTEVNGTITDASGDQIFERGLKGVTPVVNPATGDILIISTNVITGGTGKYEGATGSYANVFRANLFNPAGVDSLNGTITFPCNGNNKNY
jgi:hypothetical protein